MEKQLWMMEVTMNEAQEEMVPRLPVGRDHPYDGPLQYRLSDACGNERDRITIGQNDVMIEEDFTPPKQWQPDTTYEKDVKVRNTGSVPCYIRVYAALSDTAIPAHMDFDTKDWTQADDGYWYHNSIVEPGSRHLQSVHEGDDWNIETESQKTFNIIIYAESVQAEGHHNIRMPSPVYNKGRQQA